MVKRLKTKEIDMKRLATLCAAACLAIGLLPAKAFSLGNVNTSFNQQKSWDSHENKSINDSTVNATSNSNNRFDNSRRDDHSNSGNRYDNSDRSSSSATDSHNTDSRDYSDRSTTDSHAITDSFKGNDNSVGKVADSYNGDRRTYNIEGSVSKSVIGDFNQKTAGTDFGSGGLNVSGSSNTIGGATSVSNTFGDVTISNTGK